MPPTPASNMPTMAKQTPPKTMSSRLAAMKFMQRGAAAAAAAAAQQQQQTPQTDSPATPRSDASSAKRRKFNHTPSATGSPATPAAAIYDHEAIKAAAEEENRRNQAAIERRAAELGDSHWVLEGAASAAPPVARPLLNVVQVNFTEIDRAGAADVDDDPFGMGGAPAQPQFRRFNMKKSKAVKKEDEKSNSSESDSESASEDGEVSEEDERSAAPAARDEPSRGRQNALGDAERKRARSSVSSRREEERKKAQQLAANRRKKEIKLNKLTSISSAGSQAFQKPSATMSCHGCGKPGHKVADCPNKKKR